MKSKILVGALALMVAGSAAAQTTVDVSSITDNLAAGTAAITSVGLGKLALAGISLVYSWVKGAAFA